VSYRAIALISVLFTLVLAPSAQGDVINLGAGQSFESAYRLASAGDVILVPPAVGGAQHVPSGTKPVTFRGLPGNKIFQLDNDASNVVFDGLNIDAGGEKSPGFGNGGDNVTFKNGRIGNITDEKGAIVSGTNFTFDNVYFHDVVMRGPDVHLECVYAVSVPGFTVRNSTFRNCGVMDLFFLWGGWWSPQPPAYGNVTIENNVFGHVLNNDGSWNYYAVYIGQTGNDVLDGWVVRNNTFEQNVSLTTSHSRAVRSRWVGNLGGWDCIDGMVYKHNVGEKCGATDKKVSPNGSAPGRPAPFGWVDPAHGDFRLQAGSPAIGAADPTDHPATDRNGFVRDNRPDAGAHEFGAGPGGTAPAPQQPTAWRLKARLKPKFICRHARRGCRTTTKLRLRLGRRDHEGRAKSF
jgi:hypothetical protein